MRRPAGAKGEFMTTANLVPGAALAAERPWFKQPFVWMVIGIPLSSVIVGMIMLWLSIVSFDGMVADDYYKRGLQINRVLDRERAALHAELAGRLDLRATTSVLSLESGKADFQLPDKVQVQMSFATSAGQDEVFTMTRTPGADVYSGPALNLPQGRWYVYITSKAVAGDAVEDGAGGWRLSGTLITPGAGVVSLRPQAPKPGG
jgi:hypothetical protein